VTDASRRSLKAEGRVRLPTRGGRAGASPEGKSTATGKEIFIPTIKEGSYPQTAAMTMTLFDTDSDPSPPDTEPDNTTPEEGDDTPKFTARDVFSIVGEEGLGITMDRLFNKMEIAEKRISFYMNKHPEIADEIDNSFPYLCPTDPLQRKREEVYVSHINELLERIVGSGSLEDAPLQLATKAECLVTISEASMATPLPRDAYHAFVMLVGDVLPEESPINVDGQSARTEYEQDRAERVFHDVRRKVSKAIDRSAAV